MRIIKVELHAISCTGLGQFFDDVALERRSIHAVISAGGGLEERKSIVMARGDGDIFCATVADSLHPCVGIEARGIEGLRQLGIFPAVDVLIVHHPFASGEHGIESPVEEDTKLLVLKLFACFAIFNRGLIGCLCPACVAQP